MSRHTHTHTCTHTYTHVNSCSPTHAHMDTQQAFAEKRLTVQVCARVRVYMCYTPLTSALWNTLSLIGPLDCVGMGPGAASANTTSSSEGLSPPVRTSLRVAERGGNGEAGTPALSVICTHVCGREGRQRHAHMGNWGYKHAYALRQSNVAHSDTGTRAIMWCEAARERWSVRGHLDKKSWSQSQHVCTHIHKQGVLTYLDGPQSWRVQVQTAHRYARHIICLCDCDSRQERSCARLRGV